MIRTTIKLSAGQKSKLKLLGGSKFLNGLIANGRLAKADDESRKLNKIVAVTIEAENLAEFKKIKNFREKLRIILDEK